MKEVLLDSLTRGHVWLLRGACMVAHIHGFEVGYILFGYVLCIFMLSCVSW